MRDEVFKVFSKCFTSILHKVCRPTTRSRSHGTPRRGPRAGAQRPVLFGSVFRGAHVPLVAISKALRNDLRGSLWSAKALGA